MQCALWCEEADHERANPDRTEAPPEHAPAATPGIGSNPPLFADLGSRHAATVGGPGGRHPALFLGDVLFFRKTEFGHLGDTELLSGL